ncbi:hypothetical protein QZH41_017719 [Actinostola sp. cb2023]|nr:hypothetical protein QZH41_017719 [Actinostola sp. cb2023]
MEHKYLFDEYVTAAVMRQKGGSALILSGRSIIFLDLETDKREVVATVQDDKPTNRFNDGKCDPVSTMGAELTPAVFELEQGCLFSFDEKQTVKVHVEKVSLSNGLAWSLDNKTFYFIDSIPAGCVYAFDYDLTSGSISNKRTIIMVDPSLGIPDGMTIDVDGMLWIAMYNGGKVVRYDPSNGKVLQTVTLPATKTTSVCWAGPNYDELLVTSACLSPEEKKSQPLAGSVFKIKNLGTSGLPLTPYCG